MRARDRTTARRGKGLRALNDGSGLPGTDHAVADDGLGEVLLTHGDPGRGRVTVDVSARPERRPGAVAVAVAPGYPGRAPHPAGNPEPARSGGEAPAAVVVGRPAPGIFGHERPAPLGQDPVAVPVRAPSGGNGRYPDLAVVRDKVPMSVRRQPLHEDLLVDFGARFGSGRLWSGRQGVHLVARGRRRRWQGRYLGLVANGLPFDDAAPAGAHGEGGDNQGVQAGAHVLFSASLDA